MSGESCHGLTSMAMPFAGYLYDFQTLIFVLNIFCIVCLSLGDIFFNFSWNHSATFRKRGLLLSSTQKKIKEQLVLLQIPKTPTFGAIPEVGWKSHPGIRSQCHKNQRFLGTNLEKKKNHTGMSIEVSTLGFVRGQSQTPGADPGTMSRGRTRALRA